MMKKALSCMAVAFLVGCHGEMYIHLDTAGDTAWLDTGDTGFLDTGIYPTETETEFIEPPEGFAFCAAGGRVTGDDGMSATLCLGPMDLSGAIVHGADHSWHPGPIFILDPY